MSNNTRKTIEFVSILALAAFCLWLSANGHKQGTNGLMVVGLIGFWWFISQ